MASELPLNASTSSNVNGLNVSSASGTTFEAQRAAIVSEIAVNLDHVLQNINALNRSLEGIIAVGSEFSAVEALWSQFETVMTGREPVYAEEEEVVEEETQDESQSESQA